MLDIAIAYRVSNLKNAKQTGITTPPELSPPLLASITIRIQKKDPINSRDYIGNISLCLHIFFMLLLDTPHHSHIDSHSSLDEHLTPYD